MTLDELAEALPSHEISIVRCLHAPHNGNWWGTLSDFGAGRTGEQIVSMDGHKTQQDLIDALARKAGLP